MAEVIQTLFDRFVDVPEDGHGCCINSVVHILMRMRCGFANLVSLFCNYMSAMLTRNPKLQSEQRSRTIIGGEYLRGGRDSPKLPLMGRVWSFYIV